MWDKRAPYDSNGNLMHYAASFGFGRNAFIWRPVEEFKASMEYLGYSRGRSAAYMKFVDRDSQSKYPMFLVEFDKIVRKLRFGKINGVWTVRKRGQNFGIELVQEDDNVLPNP